MSFIGVVANRKCFENIKKNIIGETKEEILNLIPINLRSIGNIKNIKFETIIIEDNIEKFKENKKVLEKICEDTPYVIINTDKNQNQKIIKKDNQIITYGLNQKAMVTVSSISDSNVLIYWQKNLKDKQGNQLEIEERRIKKKEKSTIKTYEILIIYTLYKIYRKPIIEEI